MNDDEMSRFEFGEVFEGRFSKCTKCPNMVAGKPSLCPQCRDLAIGSDRSLCESERAAVATIPMAYRWADPRAKQWETDPKRRRTFTEAEVEAISRIPCVLFVGPTRAGKTTLASACLRRWARRGSQALFMPSAELAVARHQYPMGKGEAPTVLAALRARLLLIDDLGLEVDLPTSPVCEVIYHRRANNRPTWVTTGLTLEQLIHRYGPHIEARLIEGAKIIKTRVKEEEKKP